MAGLLDGKVAIITGAGGGLGEAYAKLFAKEGAAVVVNDLGGARDGSGSGTSAAAEKVVADIKAAGGRAVANGDDVSTIAGGENILKTALDAFGKVDILVCNAGILRDKTFAKLTPENFALVLAVHLTGSVNCTRAVWEIMRNQGYGRVVLTSSASGIYGNFGQSNYGAAKAAMIGLMNVLHLEGAKFDIRVNTLAPTAATGMTEGLITPEEAALLAPETVSPGVLYLTHQDAPSRMILGAGAGVFAVTHITETEGAWLPPEQRTARGIAAAMDRIDDPAGARTHDSALDQTRKFVRMARDARA